MRKQLAFLPALVLGLVALLTACSEPKVRDSHQPSEPVSLGTFGWMAEFDSGGCMVSFNKQAAIDLNEQSLMDVRSSSCSVVRITARSLRLGEPVAACPGVKVLMVECDEMGLNGDLSAIFPNLQSLTIITDAPVDLSKTRIETNTLMLIGPWSSLAGLDSSRVKVVQLIVESDSLMEIDSVYFGQRQGILSLYETPVGQKMRALCSTPGECNQVFGASDSLVLLY